MKKWMALALSILMLLTSALTVGAVPEEETTTTTAVEGDIFISMEVARQDNGALKVQLFDDRGGVVSMWPVSLTVNGQIVEQLVTDMIGVAAFSYAIPADATDIVVEAVDGEYLGTVFVGCSMTVDAMGQTTAPTEATTTTVTETTTTQPTDVQDVATSLSVPLHISSAASVEDNTRIGVGVDVEEPLVKASGTAGDVWTAKSRLWMDKAHYASLVSDSQATLHLQLGLNPQAATPDKLIAAKNADETFASFADDRVYGLALDFKMIYIDGDSRVQIEQADGMYTVEIPVPEMLANCRKIAVGVCTQDGVNSLLELKPTGGVLKFSVKRFQTLALIGFGEGGAIHSMMQMPSLLVVFGIVGMVLIASGVALIVLFALRRHKSAVLADLDNDAKDDTRQVMLSPTSEVVVGTGDGSDKEEVQSPVLLDYDEQSDLSREERARFRAKEGDPKAIARLESESVPPAHQIDPSQINADIPEQPQPVDELLSELDELLEEIDEDLNGNE